MAAHRINRLEVELHSGDAALARMLSERTSRMHGDRIAPVLDRVCSELGGSDARVRIDQLEVDLGTVAADPFEADFTAKLEQALRAALARALARRGPGDQRAQAALEALETFALTGGLPWWAPQDGNAVAHHFARAVALAETELVALLRRLAGDPGALDRIARLCDPDALVALVERTQGGQPIPRGVDLRERRILLSMVVARGQQVDDLHGARPARTRAEDPPHDDSQPATDRRLRGARRPPTSTDEGPLPGQPPNHDEAAEEPRSAASRPADDSHSRWQPADQPPPDEPPPPPPGTLAAASPRVAPRSPSSPSSAGSPSSPSSPGSIDTPDLTTNAPRVPSPPAESVPNQHLTPPASTATTPLPPLATVPHPLSASPTPTAAIRAARRGALARLDELYVDDAGLVILWPFLERFFVRAGVLGEDRRFFDEAAQQQAVALLEVLATADPEPLEFRLPLAKLLCGRPIESDFFLERPLTPEQLAEADHLLTAAIDRAPMLGEISIPSFRAAFLARPGALGTRDGAWLLQVERQTHDVVLDRFPWSWGWIRLPWMPDPLRVEW